MVAPSWKFLQSLAEPPSSLAFPPQLFPHEGFGSELEML